MNDKSMDEILDELRNDYGELACRVAAAYISCAMGNALQTEYKKLDKKTVGTAWLMIAKRLMELGPGDSAEALILWQLPKEGMQ